MWNSMEYNIRAKKKQFKINLAEVSQRHILLIIDYPDYSRF